MAVVKTAALLLAGNYGVHVGTAVAYAKVCVPQDVWDIARSFVTTASPVCSFLLNAMQVTQTNFALILATSLASGMTSLLKAP